MLGRLGMRLGGQRLLERHRGALTAGATPALGDILRYQARGGRAAPSWPTGSPPPPARPW
ncbi:hypothetical protein ACFQ0M_05710 [Kitasatospora aburaviensis]